MNAARGNRSKSLHSELPVFRLIKKALPFVYAGDTVTAVLKGVFSFSCSQLTRGINDFKDYFFFVFFSLYRVFKPLHKLFGPSTEELFLIRYLSMSFLKLNLSANNNILSTSRASKYLGIKLFLSKSRSRERSASS